MIVLLVACGAAVLGIVLVTVDLAAMRLRTVLSPHRERPRDAHRPTGSDVAGGPESTLGSDARPSSSAAVNDPYRAIAVIDRAAALLRIGMPPATVTTQLAEVSDPDLAAVLIRVSRSMSLGDDPRTAIARHVDGLPPTLAEVLVGMGAVWEVAESAGAPAADVLTRYAHSRREIADAERERVVALAGPQATVTVLTWLPAAGLGLALLIGADLGSLLVSPVGLASIGGGIVLLACGRVWMKRMLEQAT
ncbi:type II secretion system F family protein [Brevibacterium jeotgali]|uniref:Type II secretion system (T2SS), protein F n=1 Tax=Brevibacterium jeotgali TaxID=1262550 RepID=A0A2H1L1C0_9MICO|nr:type II secretion system F family protein [Brevibacterium jeotgali]TWC02020.1 type II secretion system (T2SS) protein F [Brevibacterium jeotgali]SMY10629.1 Type II secretion system (T2SS), protein F [Brevibacterium jeotgali]